MGLINRIEGDERAGLFALELSSIHRGVSDR